MLLSADGKTNFCLILPYKEKGGNLYLGYL